MAVLPQTAQRAAGIRSKTGNTAALTPYFFVLPYLVVFLLFRLGPSLAGLGISLTNWQAVGAPQWIGLRNFEAMLTRDANFGVALKNTFTFTLITVPCLLVLGLGLALLLNQRMRGRAVGRVAAFTPYVIMSTVVGVVWTWILDKDFGLLNVYTGVDTPWLVSERVAMAGVILATVWWTAGYNMVLFLAGLQDIPEELYEAARIDGANAANVFRFVTLPMLAPTLFVVLMLTIINSFQIFDQVYVMTSGGPGTATLTLVQYIYTQSFQYQKFGYGSAIAVVLFLILVVIAIFQTRAYRRGLEGVS
jgi:multiple sugar transport system permease protein